MVETSLKYATVVGRFVSVTGDSPDDDDDNPDIVPLQGTVTFTAKPKAVFGVGADGEPVTINMRRRIVARLDGQGYLTVNGARGVRLLANDSPGINPAGFTYHVSFSLNDRGQQQFDYGPFDISVPYSDTPHNLLTLSPAPANPGEPILQGVGLTRVSFNDEGAFVFDYTNGLRQTVPFPAGKDYEARLQRIEDRLTALEGQAPVIEEQDPPTTVARRFVVLGDSHSDYTPPSNLGTWWWRVAADTAGLVEVNNFAVRGWSSQHALEGFEGKPSQITQAEASPGDLALIMLGGNDLVFGLTPVQHKTNLMALSNRLKTSGKRVIIVSPPPLFATLDTQYGVKYRQFRTEARNAASETGAYYVDTWPGMAKPDGTCPTKWDSGDTVHLNDAGQTAMGLAVATNLQKFAGITDPWGGDTRELDWTAPDKQYVDGTGLITLEPAPTGTTPFRSATVARLRGGAGLTALNAQTGAQGGERLLVEYPYRMGIVSLAHDDAGLVDSFNAWPAPDLINRHGSRRTPGEGVRRYEVVVPAGSQGSLPTVGFRDVKGTIEALIGPARISVITDEGAPYRVVTNDIW